MKNDLVYIATLCKRSLRVVCGKFQAWRIKLFASAVIRYQRKKRAKLAKMLEKYDKRYGTDLLASYNNICKSHKTVESDR